MVGGHSGWKKWVRHCRKNRELLIRGVEYSQMFNLPWRSVCGKCAPSAQHESGQHANKTSGNWWQRFCQRFWKCDRCGVHRFWRKRYEFYPPIRIENDVL